MTPAILDQFLHAVPDAVILADADGRIVLANAQAERLFGYASGALAGIEVEALMPSSVRAVHRGYRGEYTNHPRARPMGVGSQRLVGLRQDGSEFPVDIALSPIDFGERVHYLASIRDVSDNRRARPALVRARYDRLVARIGEMVLASPDEDAVFARLPEELAAALGVDAVAILDADPGQDRVQVRTAHGLDESLRRAAPWSLDPHNSLGWVVARHEPVIVDDFATAVDPRPSPRLIEAGFRSSVVVPLLGRGRPMGALVALSRRPRTFDHDAMHCLQSIANLLAALIQRRHTEEQLAHSQRLEAIGQLTGGIAHDFNNMLTVVSGNLQLLELECGANRAAGELIDGALHAVRHGAELTGKLLAFARRQRLSPRPVAPAPLLHELGSLLRRTLGEPIRIDIDCAPDMPAVFADAAQLEAALINLALNARDAMPRGGRLRIAVRQRDIDEDGGGNGLSPGRYVSFTVGDTGHGMAPDVLAHAFEPFFTTKSAGKGNGLGLSMVYGFVMQSGGGLHAESRLGYGTRIELLLPVAGEAGSLSRDEPAPSSLQGHETVLVVEDEPAVRGIADAFLRSLGYRVVVSSDPEAALDCLRTRQDIDLLFSDVVLGDGKSGVELADAARRLHAGLPVLLASGYEHQALPGGDESSSRFELLRKPYRREELAVAIRRQLDRRH